MSYVVMMMVIGVVCEMFPLVAVIVTVYVPGVPLHVRVDVAKVPSDTLVGVREHDRPLVGMIEEVRFTVPAKPARLLRLIVANAFVPVLAVTDIGLEPITKSAGCPGFTCDTVMKS